MARQPDFAAVASAALAMADILLPDLIGGKRKGNEWLGETKANGGPGDSWCVNLTTGAWLHGAGDEKGGDIISLWATRKHLKQGAAKIEVAQLVGLGAADRSQPVLNHVRKPREMAAEPIPLSVQPPQHHRQYGAPSATYRYGDRFWVCRYDYGEGQKHFCPFTWRNNRWAMKAWPDPRPLYRLSDIIARPGAQVLIVEGEKCADAASKVLPEVCVTTWANGAAAVKTNDWEPLRGRDVIIWPDADGPGREAAATLATLLEGNADRVRILNPDGQPEGWDIAEAISEGWDHERLIEWMREKIGKEITAAPPKQILIEAGESAGPGSALVSWQSLGLDCGEGGAPHATMANASLILQVHPDFKGRIWLDSFRNKIYHTLRGPLPKPWTDADSRRVTARIQQQLRLHKINMRIMQDAIHHAAECHEKNSLTDWLDSLEWDGETRLTTWLSDCLGVEHNAYSMAVARNWPIGMVARAYVPGCKMDNMPVLEGVSGAAKTTFLEVLGEGWYKSIPTAFGDKDFLQAIQGTWLVEIPDMTGFSRREHSLVLATMTIRTDNYRASYGHYVEEHPRAAVFAATSETSDYLQDARGRRRYWPLYCLAIDIDALRAQREQIFAEAVHEYRKGAKWYEMPAAETDAEQMERATPDLWTDRVMDYCDHLATQRLTITSSRILSDAVELPLAKQTDAEKRRIARIMRENGWIQQRDAIGRKWKKIVRAT